MGYDHYAVFGDFINSHTVVVAHAVLARQTVFNISGRPASPASASVPYPLVQISTDCGRTFDYVDTDYLFHGCSTAWAPPGPTPAPGTSTGGVKVVTSMSMLRLNDDIFLAFDVDADAGDESRFWRGADFASLVQLPTPPGFGTTWHRLREGSFASTRAGLIGFTGFPDNPYAPALLFVSSDRGETWMTRPLPWPCGRVGFVRDVSRREIGVPVYEDILSLDDPVPCVRMWTSRDFGVSWQPRGVMARAPRHVGADEYLQDFLITVPLITADDSITVPRPMSGYVYDYRVSAEPFVP